MDINLLDCTLREAPVEGLIYGNEFIQDFVNSLERTGINIIEIGFLKNAPYKEGSAIFQRTEEIEPFLKNKKEGVIYTALVDYGRYDLKYLSQCNGKSIDAIRVCFKKGEQDSAFEYSKQIKEKGYKVFFQHVDTIGYKKEEIEDIVKKVNELKPYAYSIVDTFGAMYQDDVEKMYTIISSKLDEGIILGFHGHNNLLLANANTQYFLSIAKNRKKVNVDASILGCGRSAGNAQIELLAEFLNKKYSQHYNFSEILKIIDNLMPQIQAKCQWGYKIQYAICAMNNTHTFNAKYLTEKYNVDSNRLLEIITKIEKKNLYNYDELDKLYNETKDKKYRAIIFDLDGTLLNTTVGVIEAVQTTIRELGLKMPSDEILHKFVGPRMQDSFEKYFMMDPKKALECANIFRENYKKSLYNAKLYEGTLELLENLKKAGFKIAVATNKSHQNAVSILDKFEILKYCDFAFGSDLEGKLTKADIIETCLRKLNVTAEESVLIGDSTSDSDAAHILKMDFIAVTYGFGFKSANDASNINHVNICKDIPALSNYLLSKEEAACWKS